MNRAASWLPTILLLVLATGCGQKGPLRLPTPKLPISVADAPVTVHEADATKLAR